jgi:hypothetical protein
VSKSSDVAFGRQSGRNVRYKIDDCAGPELPPGVARVRCSTEGQRFLVSVRDVGTECPCGDGTLVRVQPREAVA